MSAKRESTAKTILVATILCVVCSLVVSTVAVKLKPLQQKNSNLDRKKNILMAAGLLEDKNADVSQIFESRIEQQLIDFESGEQVEGRNPEQFFVQKALKDPEQTYRIPSKEDIAGIKFRTKIGKVYLIKDDQQVVGYILPIVAKGLWSTMYGFVALANDTSTVKGFGFYKQGETPGLGGEVDNPRWKSQWEGKEIFNDKGENVFRIVQGGVAQDASGKEHMIDGISGATITVVGVQNAIRYWLGDNAYGPFLARMRSDLALSRSSGESEESKEVSSES